mgnify:CR=1 FL=1
MKVGAEEEVKALLGLRGYWAPKLMDYFVGPSHVYLVTEYCHNGNLGSFCGLVNGHMVSEGMK